MSELWLATTQELKIIRKVKKIKNALEFSNPIHSISDQLEKEVRINSLNPFRTQIALDLFWEWEKYGSCFCFRCCPTWKPAIKRLRYRRNTRLFHESNLIELSTKASQRLSTVLPIPEFSNYFYNRYWARSDYS